MMKILKYSSVFVSLIFGQTAYATVLTLDESGNYIVSDGVDANYVAPPVSGEKPSNIEITSLRSPDDEAPADIEITSPESREKQVAVEPITEVTSLGYDVIITDLNILKAHGRSENISTYENYEVIITDPDVLRKAHLDLESSVVNKDGQVVFPDVVTQVTEQADSGHIINNMTVLEQQSELDENETGIQNSELANTYDHIIKAELSKYSNIDMAFVKSVIKAESNFNPTALSPKGAMGLMQLMPQTAETYDVTNPFSAEENIRAGVAELSRLMDVFNNPALALAGYNAGQSAVEKYDGVPPYRETQEYIVKVLTYTFQARVEAKQAVVKNSTVVETEAEEKDKKLLPMVIRTFN